MPDCRVNSREELIEAALEEHVYRTIGELFGKDEGYCRGRGGSMHIADFTVGHLGANAIVGGGVPIATGAAMASRYFGEDARRLLLRRRRRVRQRRRAGIAELRRPGAVHQPLRRRPRLRPADHLPHLQQPLRHDRTAPTTRSMGVRRLARRAAGFADNNMHAEIVNGMDVLAVRDAVLRAAETLPRRRRPGADRGATATATGAIRLSDPRNEYRTQEEEAAWKAIDPIETYKQRTARRQGARSRRDSTRSKRAGRDRNARAAKRAVAAADPDAEDVLKYMYTDTKSEIVPAPNSPRSRLIAPLPEIKRVNGEITYKDALREALVEEMMRDNRVVFYGEDVADYGGAFKVDQGPARDRSGATASSTRRSARPAFAAPAVGAAMRGLRPVVELMYFDFALMSSDQISNQAAKWHYMSGAQTEVPLVIRASAGAARATAASIRRRSNPCSATSPASTWSIRRRRPTRRAC